MTAIEASDWLRGRDRFLLLTHRRPDGDTLGSAAGLAQGLIEAGKTAYLLFNPEATPKYVRYVERYWAPEGFAPEHIIAVDVASPDMLQTNGRAYSGSVGLCVDHHPSNTGYAQNVCLEPSKAACGEIVCEILLSLVGKISEKAAVPLYVAVSTDTGCFAFANTTAATLRVAADLADAGAPIGELNRLLFRQKPRSRALLEAMIITGLEYHFGGAVAIATVTREMMEKAGAGENEADDIAALPGAIEGVEAGITIRELDGQEGSKVSVRTTRAVNANDLCARFGGGGHAMAAGFSLALPPQEVKARLLEALRDFMPAEGADG